MLTGKTPWRAKTEKDLGKMLKTISIHKMLPKNISEQSTDFLIKTLNPNIQERLSAYLLEVQIHDIPLELNKCKSSSLLKSLPQKSEALNEKSYSSSKNSLKKLTKMNFYQPASQNENKNYSLPKTAASIKNKTEKDLNLSVIDIKQTSK